jgi:osomolarity two-component system response regulator SSK1
VNFVWFERKVKEWGCMQALIDFDGWRKWKDFDTTPSATPVKKSPTPVKKSGVVSPSAAVGKMEQKAGEKPEKEDSQDTVVGV